MAIINWLTIFSAEYLYLFSILIAGAYFFTISKDQKKNFVFLTAIALPCIYIISKIAANLYFDPRPFVVGYFNPLIPHAADNGFPSDHVLLTSAISSIVFIFNKKLSTLLWLITLVVGIARVVAGVHHTVDILGAIIISIIITFLVDMILKYQKVIFYQP